MTFTYFDLLFKENGFTPDDCPLAAVNDEGENVVVEYGVTEDGEAFFQTLTCQSNGWARVNTYYEDGSVDETYTR